MIVDRIEFKKFWDNIKKYPDIIFCRKKYYLMSIDNLYHFIKKYIEAKKNLMLLPNKSWDCSKFCIYFKIFCDLIYKDLDNGAHLSIGIAHIELENENEDHAVNIIFFKNRLGEIDFVFFDPQSNELNKNKEDLKKINFIYF